MPDHPVISFSIVSWNVRELLWTCLDSIRRYVEVPFEVIVVDNASSDSTVEMIRREFPEVQVIANDRNVGFAQANNQAFAVAKGDFLVALNPDTELIDDPFPVLLEYLEGHANCAVVGPELLNYDRSHQQSVHNFPTLADQVIVLLKLRLLLPQVPAMRRYYADPGRYRQTPISVDQLMGACIVFPRWVLSEIGGFDPGYPNWFEEVDWCKRIQLAGYQRVYHPGSHLLHHRGQSFNQVLSFKKQRWFTVGLRRYAKKYWSPWARAVVTMLTPFNLTLAGLQTLLIRY